jgi:hypothetical protein
VRIVTVQFDNILDEELRDYGLLLKVFQYSVFKHMPDTNFEAIKISPPKKDPPKEYFQTKNTVKLGYWVDAIKASNENTAIMDCDMLVLRDMADAFDFDFDIGYTIRTSKIKLNGGLLFIRPNKKSIRFLETWVKINQAMYDSIGTDDSELYESYRKKYAGMNQASLGWMLENYEPDIKIKPFPCVEWNVCQEDWATFDPETARCLHIKSKLRQMCLADKLKHPRFIEAFCIWKEYKKEAFEKEPEEIK